MVVSNDIDTIDASEADTSFIDHADYAEAKSIIADLFELLRYQWLAKSAETWQTSITMLGGDVVPATARHLSP